MKKILTLLSPFILIFNAYSQNINGFIENSNHEKINNATVLLQTIDSTFLEATITDSLGGFEFVSNPEIFMIVAQHILYEPHCEKYSKNNIGTITLIEKDFELDEVSVKGDQPVVSVVDNALSYNVSHLTKNKSINNAFDILLQVPGITISGNSISLIAANNLHVLINGKRSNLTINRVIELLKSYPASQIKKIDVMYNAPAKYGVRGAVVNIEVIKPEIFIGELGTKAIYSYYPSAQINGNLLFPVSKLDFDVFADYSKGQKYSEVSSLFHHSFYNDIYVINKTTTNSTSFDHVTLKLSCDYDINDKSSLFYSYYFKGSDEESELQTNNNFSTSLINSSNNKNEKVAYQDLHLEYNYENDNFEFSVDGDFTSYTSPNEVNFTAINNDLIEIDNFFYESNQTIRQEKLFANFSYLFPKQWSIDVGSSVGYNTSKTELDYYSDDTTNYSGYSQKELTTNFFMEVKGAVTNKLTFTVGFEGESYESYFYEGEEELNLWNEFILFPKLHANYFVNQQNIYQLNISNNKKYPSYWSVSPLKIKIDDYTTQLGNPLLKPYREYSGQLINIRKQKYVFVLGTTYMPDYFSQLPYQSSDEIKVIYKYVNYDFSLFSNISAIIPVKYGDWLSGRVAFHALRMQDKMTDFYDISFNNEAYIGAVNFNGTITFPKTPLFIQLYARYQTPAILGVYKLGNSFDSSISLKYEINKNIYMNLAINNIFLDKLPNPYKIGINNQYSITKTKELLDLSFLFVWKFGNYNKSETGTPDLRRFKR